MCISELYLFCNVTVEAFSQWWRAFKQHNTKQNQPKNLYKPADFKQILHSLLNEIPLIALLVQWLNKPTNQFKDKELLNQPMNLGKGTSLLTNLPGQKLII